MFVCCVYYTGESSFEVKIEADSNDKCKKTAVYTHVNGDSHIENSKNHKR